MLHRRHQCCNWLPPTPTTTSKFPGPQLLSTKPTAPVASAGPKIGPAFQLEELSRRQWVSESPALGAINSKLQCSAIAGFRATALAAVHHKFELPY